jgi:hypothetical protein
MRYSSGEAAAFVVAQTPSVTVQAALSRNERICSEF